MFWYDGMEWNGMEWNGWNARSRAGRQAESPAYGAAHYTMALMATARKAGPGGPSLDDPGPRATPESPARASRAARTCTGPGLQQREVSGPIATWNYLPGAPFLIASDRL